MKINKIDSVKDIPAELLGTPFEELLLYQNFAKPLEKVERAQMLVAMCMDNRKQLRIPENFAFIIRTGGANLRYSEFKVSYSVAIGGINHIALIAHNNCGMVGITSKTQQFIDGLARLPNWNAEKAKEHFFNYAPMFEIEDEAVFVLEESKRLSQKYEGIKILPMYYTLEDNRLSIITDD